MSVRDMADRLFDPPSVVKACLNCKKPKCTNCVKKIPRSQLHRPREKKERKNRETKTND